MNESSSARRPVTAAIENAGEIVLIVLLLVLVLLEARIGLEARFLADDYCQVALVNRLGVMGAWTYYYANWTGVFSTMLVAVTTAKGGPGFAGYLVFGIVVTGLLSLVYGAFAMVRPARGEGMMTTCLGIAVVAATLCGAPDIDESLYWRSGAIPYAGGAFCLALVVAVVATAYRKPTLRRILIVFVLCFFASGLSQVEAVMLVTGFVLALASSLGSPWGRENRALSRVAMSGLLGSSSALAIIVAAPGNATRMSYYPSPPHLHAVFRFSAEYANDFLSRATSENLIWMFGLVAIGMLVRHDPGGNSSLERAETLIVFVRKLLVGGGALWLVVVAAFVPGTYGLSAPLPPRVQILPWFVVVASAVWLGILLRSLNVFPSTGVASVRLRLGILAVSCVAIVSISVSTIPEKASYLRYHSTVGQAWDRVEQRLTRAGEKGENRAVIPLVGRMGGLDPESDPGHWVNRCIADYHGLETITAIPVDSWIATHARTDPRDP